MPETTREDQLTEDLDERIEALLAEMQAACDRVAAELDGDPKLSADETADAMVASGGPIDDQGAAPPEPAPEPEPEPASAPEPEAEPQGEQADASGSEAAAEEPAESPAGENDESAIEPTAEPEPEPLEQADAPAAEPSSLDAQVGAMIDDALQTDPTPEPDHEPEADPDPEPEAESDAPTEADASPAPEPEPASDPIPEPPGDVDDLDTELAALAGEMLEHADIEPDLTNPEPPPPQPSGTPTEAAPPAASAEPPAPETPPASAADPEPATAEVPEPAAPGTATETRTKPAPSRSLGFPPCPARPTFATKPKVGIVIAAYTKTYAPWLLACLVCVLGRAFAWSAVRLGELASQSNKPIEARSKSFQHTVGWAAVVTGFNATLAWGFLIFIREPAPPPPTDTPRVEITDQNGPADPPTTD